MSDLAEDKIKRRRHRKVASCEPCRHRKLRCDRQQPCSACTAKGHPESCVWDPTSLPPLQKVSQSSHDKNENRLLREEVQRLRALVGERNHSRSPGSSEYSPQALYSSISEEEFNLDEEDLGQKLGQLTISHFLQGTKERAAVDQEEVVREAAKIVDAPPAFNSFDYNFVPEPPSTFTILSRRSAVPFSEVLLNVPSKKLLDAASAWYWKRLDWYIHAVPKQQYERLVQSLWNPTTNAIQPFELAILLALGAVGLFHMDLDKAFTAGFGVNKDATARDWIDLATTCLATGKFLEKPNLDAVRALLIMAIHYTIIGNGDHGGTGVAFLVLCVQGSLMLELHRDPDRTPGRFTREEAEDRRRIFWLTFLIDHGASGTTGRKYNMLHARDIDTKLPRDCHDEHMHLDASPEWTESEWTSIIVRTRTIQVAERITAELFGLHPVHYSQVLSLDREINEVEANVPELYRFDLAKVQNMNGTVPHLLKVITIQLAITAERLRIHRPFFYRSYEDSTYAFSREVAIGAAKQILAIAASPMGKVPWSGLNYKVVCSSILLALDVMKNPSSQDAAEHRKIIQASLVRLDKFTTTISRRGTRVIRHLLASDAARLRTSEPLAKRSRPSHSHTTSSTSQTFQHQRRNSSESDELPHKTPAPSPTDSGRLSPFDTLSITPPFSVTPHSQDYQPEPEHLHTLDFEALLGLIPSPQSYPFLYTPSISSSSTSAYPNSTSAFSPSSSISTYAPSTTSSNSTSMSNYFPSLQPQAPLFAQSFEASLSPPPTVSLAQDYQGFPFTFQFPSTGVTTSIDSYAFPATSALDGSYLSSYPFAFSGFGQ